MAFICPKSVRAIALRLTRANGSGVPLDPLTPYSRIQTAGFAELSLDPDYETGSNVVVKDPSGTAPAIINQAGSVMKGLNLGLKLCGVPFPVLEMLVGLVPLDDSVEGVVDGAVLRDGFDPTCLDPVILELWSKNVDPACDGKWIQWLVPFTFDWKVTGSITFNSGSVDVELSGYGRQNPAWFPSFPGTDFPSWVPGGGDAAGWPTGASPPVLPPGIAADEWTLIEADTIRSEGPIAYRYVSELPDPLDDCGYVGGAGCVPSTFADDLCGGGAVGSPWVASPAPVVGGLPVRSGACTVDFIADYLQFGAVPLLGNCCGGTCQIATVDSTNEIQAVGVDSTGWGVPSITAVFTDGKFLATSIALVETAGVATIGMYVVLFDPLFSALAAYYSEVPIPLVDFNTAVAQQRLSSCEDGTLKLQLTVGDTVLDFDIEGVDLVTTAAVEALGMGIGGSDVFSTSMAITNFAMECGVLPGGEVASLVTTEPFSCDFSVAVGADLNDPGFMGITSYVQTTSFFSPCTEAGVRWSVRSLELDAAPVPPAAIDLNDPGWVTIASDATAPRMDNVSYPDGIHQMLYAIVASVQFGGLWRDVAVGALFLPETFSIGDQTGAQGSIYLPFSSPGWLPVVFGGNYGEAYDVVTVSGP